MDEDENVIFPPISSVNSAPLARFARLNLWPCVKQPLQHSDVRFPVRLAITEQRNDARPRLNIRKAEGKGASAEVGENAPSRGRATADSGD